MTDPTARGLSTTEAMQDQSMTIQGLVQVSGLALGTVVGVITGLVGGGWRTLGNSYKLFLGNFYLDENAL